MMLRLALILLAALDLYGADCDACAKKFAKASISLQQGLGYCVNGSVISPFAFSSEAVYEPLTGMYIKKRQCGETISFKYPYRETKLRIYTAKKRYTSRLQKHQCALLSPGRTDPGLPKGALAHGMCCHGLGIATGVGLLEAHYINHLTKGDNPAFAQVGFRVDDSLRVRYINPYYDTDISIGDQILGFADRCAYEDAVALHSLQEPITLRIKAEGKRRFTLRKRRGGGLVSDTFLEPFGMAFDKSLQISTITTNTTAWKKGLRKGDRLLEIEQTPVSGEDDVKRVLTGLGDKETITYLFEREGFQFFIHI
jgi:hypothetical protein